jgi:hypothetical protein
MHLSRFTILAVGTHGQLNPRDRVFKPPFRNSDLQNRISEQPFCNSDLREGGSQGVRISRFEILAAGIGSLNPHLRISSRKQFSAQAQSFFDRLTLAFRSSSG